LLAAIGFVSRRRLHLITDGDRVATLVNVAAYIVRRHMQQRYRRRRHVTKTNVVQRKHTTLTSTLYKTTLYSEVDLDIMTDGKPASVEITWLDDTST
jgi:hypothetical protein